MRKIAILIFLMISTLLSGNSFLNPDPINHLIETHYKPNGRPYRCCQPRDLLSQVRNYCLYMNVETELKEEYFDYAVENYFAVM